MSGVCGMRVGLAEVFSGVLSSVLRPVVGFGDPGFSRCVVFCPVGVPGFQWWVVGAVGKFVGESFPPLLTLAK